MAYGRSRNNGLGLTFRSGPSGRLNGTTTRSGLPNLRFNSGGGSSTRLPGTGLTFHERNGRTVASSEYVPGVGTFTKDIRTGKLKSFTDTQGFRSGPNGKSKGSSRSY